MSFWKKISPTRDWRIVTLSSSGKSRLSSHCCELDVVVSEGMCEVSVMCGMKSGGLVAGKREGIVSVMRVWTVVSSDDGDGGISQREEPGILIFAQDVPEYNRRT